MAVSSRYSHRNLRIERTDKAGTVRYVFDLDGSIIEEHRGDELIRYVFRRGKHLAKITPDGTYYYGTDRLGSTTVMFDGEGSVVWRGDVSPFGELVSSEGSIEERVKFTGKDYDEAAGLYYFNARWYDAELGRFTTEDPARDGLNWYVYVRNNPLRYVDPTGLESADAAYARQAAMSVKVKPTMFTQNQFKESFGQSFSATACAATSLLNEISEQYTTQTREQLTFDQGLNMMQNAVDNGSIDPNNAFVSWEDASNDMWSDTGLMGDWNYDDSGFSHRIYALQTDADPFPDHFLNSIGDTGYHDPWDGKTGDIRAETLVPEWQTRNIEFNMRED